MQNFEVSFGFECRVHGLRLRVKGLQFRVSGGGCKEVMSIKAVIVRMNSHTTSVAAMSRSVIDAVTLAVGCCRRRRSRRRRRRSRSVGV